MGRIYIIFVTFALGCHGSGIHDAAIVTDFELDAGRRSQVGHLDHGDGEIREESIDAIHDATHRVFFVVLGQMPWILIVCCKRIKEDRDTTCNERVED
nr:hypothetical protein Itr_chr04CG23300 [Ipomoea trifida]